MGILQNLDVERLAQQFRSAEPFPHVVIDGLIEPEFARRVAASYPSFDDAQRVGRSFTAVNEQLKVQVTDYERFPTPVQQLSDALGSKEFMRTLEQITEIPNLVWDPTFAGGGMHQTAKSGILDVHIDFNLLEGQQLFRRLNLLVYLNPVWDVAWGGLLELWDREVKVLHRSVVPAMGRAVLFETSEVSFHGVTAVQCPPSVARKSFALYYYTREAPGSYSGVPHSTIFKARPYEYKKRFWSMPIETAERRVRGDIDRLKGKVKTLLGRS